MKKHAADQQKYYYYCVFIQTTYGDGSWQQKLYTAKMHIHQRSTRYLGQIFTHVEYSKLTTDIIQLTELTTYFYLKRT